MRLRHLAVFALALVPLAASAEEPPATDSAIPIRAQRRFVIGGEVGWNALGGLGLNLMYRPMPYLSLDAAGGLSGVGWKTGARVRVNPLTSAWTPTLGVGVMYGLGTGSAKVESTVDGNTVGLKVKPSTYLQFVGGAEYCGTSGFTFLATLGYAHLLKDNVEITQGTPTEEQKDGFKTAFGSGLEVGLTLGYAF